MSELSELMADAARLRDRGHGRLISYSRKVFIPLTKLCRDVCHYCTFAETPHATQPAYLSPDEVLAIARAGKAAGCTEALFTLGDKPELRYRAAREALAALGYESTIAYLTAMCALVLRETGLLPHANPGVMTREEIAALREVTASQGIMLESTSERLCEKGGVHYGSPDKHPAVRLETIRLAGELKVPFTTGILIGIGETREERLDALRAIGDLHAQYGHIQEVIVQNFRAKSDTKLADADEPDLDDLLLDHRPGAPDPGAGHEHPGAAQPVARRLSAAGRCRPQRLGRRLAGHARPREPRSAVARRRGAGAQERRDRQGSGQSPRRLSVLRSPARALAGARGGDAGAPHEPTPRAWRATTTGRPATPSRRPRRRCCCSEVDPEIVRIVDRATGGKRLDHPEIQRLFTARDADYRHVTGAADALRQAVSGDVIRYVVNRNINYTNICYFRCRFCAFSKGRTHDDLRGKPYDLALEEVSRRAVEAWERGATEVCLQGGIHPDYTGETYEAICRAIKEAVPGMHIHAFSPLEVTQGAATLDRPIDTFLARPQGSGAGHAARHRGRDPRRRGPRHHLPGQDQHRRMARRAARRPQARPAHDLDHHVRPCRDLARLGAPSAGAARPAGRDRRLHRVRAAALRAHGSADVPPGPGAPRARPSARR